ncbi:phage protein [Planococcus antarcticus DSM 14505]|uniref:Phage protein n=1 Tax=Planococcus antarcticus DSM 14505 TaxID=1185653 RepID=A0AA87LSS0_9BACL|nr:hypothetical protein [Planococcus antarcticus]EIM05322.1 phage protein [Planococcus antarcticus DSM 14505]
MIDHKRKIRRPWTKEELLYLDDKWGSFNYVLIAEKLERTPEAVKMKAIRLGYSNFQLSQDGVTLVELAAALQSDYKKLRRWVDRYDLPVFKVKITDKQRKIMVNIDSFWKWSNLHRELIDFSKLEKNTFGAEPDWLNEQRKNDFLNKDKKIKNSYWTDQEEQKLVRFVSEFRYTYTEIAAEMSRSEKTIAQKLIDLEIKARPLKSGPQKWSIEETVKLFGMMNQGCSKVEMAKSFNRSETAISGKLRKIKAGKDGRNYCFQQLHRLFLRE